MLLHLGGILKRELCINKCPQISMNWSSFVKKSGLKPFPSQSERLINSHFRLLLPKVVLHVTQLQGVLIFSHLVSECCVTFWGKNNDTLKSITFYIFHRCCCCCCYLRLYLFIYKSVRTTQLLFGLWIIKKILPKPHPRNQPGESWWDVLDQEKVKQLGNH